MTRANTQLLLKQVFGKKPGKGFQVFFVCLLVSYFIWFTRSLTKEHTDSIQFALKITGLDENLSMVSDVPEYLQVRVKSEGFDLLGGKFFSDDEEIVLDISENTSSGIVTYSAINVLRMVRESLGEDLEVIDVHPESIQFELSRTTSRKIKIEPIVSISLAENTFIEKAIYTIPDSVIITGPEKVLDSINFVYSKNIQINDVLGKDSIEVDLDVPRKVKSEFSSVLVHLPIDQYTEGKIKLAVQSSNLEEGSSIRLFPDSVTLTYQVGLNSFEAAKNADYILAVDVPENQSASRTRKLKVNLIEYPAYIRNIRIEPSRLEYIIVE